MNIATNRKVVKVEYTDSLVVFTTRWLAQTSTTIEVTYSPSLKTWDIINEKGKDYAFNHLDFGRFNIPQAIATVFDLSCSEAAELVEAIVSMQNLFFVE